MPFVITKIDQIFKIPYRLEVINDLSFSKIITKKGILSHRGLMCSKVNKWFCRTELYMTKIRKLMEFNERFIKNEWI